MECFVVYKNEIEGRIDPFYYKPEFREFEKGLSQIKLVSFGQIIKSITNGFDYRKFTEGGFIYLRVANIKPFEFDLSNIKKINPSFEINKNIQLKKGDLLLTRKGTYGIALSLDKDYDYVISSEIFRIELTQEVNPKFVEIILNSSIGQRQFNKYKIGGIMGSLSQEAVKNIKIPLPPLEIQNHIVQIMDNAYNLKKQKESEAQQLLDSIDDYVLSELGIKMPELKDRMIFVVYANDVKGKRLDAYYHQPKFEEVEKAIEKGKFGARDLKEITVNIKTGTTPHQKLNPFTKNEEIIFLRNSNLEKNKILLDNVKYVRKELENKLTFSKKNELITCIAGTIGISTVNTFDFPIAINQNISSLELKENVNPFYISSILNLKIYLKYKFPNFVYFLVFLQRIPL